MKLLLKEFLTFDEVGDYLKVRGYDLSNDDKECYSQVKSILLDLSRERGLKVVFYYYGDVYIYRAGDKDRKPMNDKKAFFKGYVTHENLTYFLDNKGKEWKSYKGDFEFPRFFHPFYSKNVTFLTNFDIDNELRDLIYLDLLELQNIKPCDLRISLTELQDILANIEKSYYKELSQQVADQQATIDQQAKEITKLKEQLASIEQADNDTQSNTPAEKILHPRTANNASKIISALASELLGMDLTQPYADNTNGRILKAIERQGNTLSKDTIADWLRQAHEISK